MGKMLEGIRVVDFTHVHAGPLCTYQLGLMGADVIKVETPGSGDQMRTMGRDQPEPGMSPGFMGQSGGKRSVAINLKDARGQEIVQALLRTADVMVLNMRPGTPERLGIDYESVRAINSSIVYCAISGYGQTGPEASRPAFDHLIQGESGMFMATGTPEQPVRVGFAVADAGTAVVASSAINAALLKQARTGEGSFLDVSMLESCMTLMGLNFYNFLATGNVGPRVGPNPLAQQGSAGTFDTADGRLLMVNANSHRLYERLAPAVGRADLLESEAFGTPAAAFENRVELRATFAEIFRTNTATYWDALLKEAGVPAGIAKTPGEVLENPQLAHRGAVTRLHNVPGMGDDGLNVLGAGFQVDGEPTAPSAPPPRLGEHTHEVLTELGFSATDLAAMTSEGVIDTPA